MADSARITRRAIVRAFPSIAAATALPVAAIAAPVEEPHAKAHRLRDELAEVLNVAWEGRFGAEVFPSQIVDSAWPKGFFDIRGHSEAWKEGQAARRYLSMVSEMDAERRAGHFGQELKQAMYDRRPGNWRTDFIRDADDELIAAIVSRHGG